MPAPDTRAPATSDRAGLGHQIKKHPFIALGLAIVASLIIGWAVGTWTTCGPRCGFDADLFGAWGAWVGGLATTGAFVFTAHELVSSRRREEKMERLRAEEVLTKARQVLCHLWRYEHGLWWYKHGLGWYEDDLGRHEDGFLGWYEDPLDSLETEELPLLFRMDNYSSSPITDIRVLAGRAKKEIRRRDQLDPRDSEQGRSSLTCTIGPTDLGLKYNPEEGHLDVDPPSPSVRVRAEFTLEGHRFQWDSNTGEVELIANPHA